MQRFGMFVCLLVGVPSSFMQHLGSGSLLSQVARRCRGVRLRPLFSPSNPPVRQSTMSRVYPLPLPLPMPNIQRYIRPCPPGAVS